MLMRESVASRHLTFLLKTPRGSSVCVGSLLVMAGIRLFALDSTQEHVLQNGVFILEEAGDGDDDDNNNYSNNNNDKTFDHHAVAAQSFFQIPFSNSGLSYSV